MGRCTDHSLTGADLPSNSFGEALLVMPLVQAVDDKAGQLFSAVQASLRDEAQLKVVAAGGDAWDESLAKRVRGELLLAGLAEIAIEVGLVHGKKRPASSTTAPVPLKTNTKRTNGVENASVSLNRNKGSKKSLWSTTAAATPPSTVDPESLLTPDDRINPSRIKGSDCAPVQPGFSLSGSKRRKRACKGCSCGLRELEEQENQPQQKGATDSVMMLDENEQDLPAGTPPTKQTDLGNNKVRKEVIETVTGVDGQAKKVKRVHVETKGATSSCGSCFLGDAFRCSSCPYMGLPAFKPGQTVSIPSGYEDDL